MPRDYRFWTSGETHRLFTLFYQNYSYEEIASIMGRSVESVRRQRQRIDKRKKTVRSRRLLSKRDLQFVELFSQVHTHAEVAQKMGVTRNSSMCKKRRLVAKGFEFPPAKGKSSNNEIVEPSVEINLPRIKICHMAVNSRQYEDDQEHFIFKMKQLVDRTQKKFKRYPTDAEVFQEALRIGYRKVS